MSRRLGRGFYARPVLEVAPELLNKVLVGPRVAGRIVEVEAYRGIEDPASHAFRGPTPRTEVMHGRAGHLYVYFSYGMHWCANVVTDGPGTAGAVLLRAATPLRGTALMHARRGPAARRPEHLCRGPARLASAFGLSGDHDGADLVTGSHGYSIRDDGTPPPAEVVRGPRVGLSRGIDLPYRWHVPGVADVSRAR